MTVETRDAVHTYVLDTSGQDLDVPFTDTWVVPSARGTPTAAPARSTRPRSSPS